MEAWLSRCLSPAVANGARCLAIESRRLTKGPAARNHIRLLKMSIGGRNGFITHNVGLAPRGAHTWCLRSSWLSHPLLPSLPRHRNCPELLIRKWQWVTAACLHLRATSFKARHKNGSSTSCLKFTIFSKILSGSSRTPLPPPPPFATNQCSISLSGLRGLCSHRYECWPTYGWDHFLVQGEASGLGLVCMHVSSGCSTSQQRWMN